MKLFALGKLHPLEYRNNHSNKVILLQGFIRILEVIQEYMIVHKIAEDLSYVVIIAQLTILLTTVLFTKKSVHSVVERDIRGTSARVAEEER